MYSRYLRTMLRRRVLDDVAVMRFFMLTLVTGFVLACVPVAAVTPGYDTAELLSATKGQDVQAFWRFTLRVRDQVLIADYRPLIPWNYDLLQEFTICAPVKVKLAGKHVYLLRPGGKEIRLGVRVRFLRPRAQMAAAAISEQKECASPSEVMSVALGP